MYANWQATHKIFFIPFSNSFYIEVCQGYPWVLLYPIIVSIVICILIRFGHFNLLSLCFEFLSLREISLSLLIQIFLERDCFLFTLWCFFFFSKDFFNFFIQILSAISHIQQLQGVFNCNCLLLVGWLSVWSSCIRCRERIHICVTLQIHKELHKIVKISRF